MDSKKSRTSKIERDAKKLPPYSPFLNIVEQAISALKAVKKLKDN